MSAVTVTRVRLFDMAVIEVTRMPGECPEVTRDQPRSAAQE